MERRDFLKTMCYGGVATFAAPVVRFAHLPGSGRLVFVLLRGGFDGLAAVVPVGDPAYPRIRGAMAFEASDLTPLADGLSLAPGLSSLEEFWKVDELVVLHALAIPYRTRSHFDGQAILETGLQRPDGAADGWLNRLLQIMEGRRSGIAVAAGMPRSLTGSWPVSTWSPAQLGAVDDAYLDRLHLLYRADPVLANPFEAALQQQETIGGDGGSWRSRSRDPSHLRGCRAAAEGARGTERRCDGVQRVGHARQPGSERRSLGPAAGADRAWAPGLQEGDG